jgi:microcystin-dependent protein
MNPFVGEIRCFGFNFAPVGWMFCEGQLLPISQYTALFSLLGTYYGGNGTSNFALPNLQGQVPMHQGEGAGLSETVIGEAQGSSTVTLLNSEMPIHQHTIVTAITEPGGAPERAAAPSSGTSYIGPSNPDALYNSTPTLNATLALQTIGIAGSSTPHDNMQPYLVLNFCIAISGVYPARN